MEMSNHKLTPLDKRIIEGANRITIYEIQNDFNIDKVIGIDPGTTNLGVCIISGASCFVYQCKIPRYKEMLDRANNVQSLLNSILPQNLDGYCAVIEGASYAKNYRQVELAEIRAVVILLLNKYNIKAQIMPPKTIRKIAWGNGNIVNPYGKEFPNDCIAALGCALAASTI